MRPSAVTRRRLANDQPRAADRPGAQMHEMPFVGHAIVRGIHAHWRNADPVAQRHVLEPKFTEQMRDRHEKAFPFNRRRVVPAPASSFKLERNRPPPAVFRWPECSHKLREKAMSRPTRANGSLPRVGRTRRAGAAPAASLAAGSAGGDCRRHRRQPVLLPAAAWGHRGDVFGSVRMRRPAWPPRPSLAWRRVFLLLVPLGDSFERKRLIVGTTRVFGVDPLRRRSVAVDPLPDRGKLRDGIDRRDAAFRRALRGGGGRPGTPGAHGRHGDERAADRHPAVAHAQRQHRGRTPVGGRFSGWRRRRCWGWPGCWRRRCLPRPRRAASPTANCSARSGHCCSPNRCCGGTRSSEPPGWERSARSGRR